jgi:hypothetical protein
MSAGLIPSTDSFATGDPDSAFFLRNGQPIATPSPLQIISPDGDSVTSVTVGNSGVTVIDSSGAVSITDAVLVPSLTATGAIVANTIDANIVGSRILFVSSGAGGLATITQAVPGLTADGVALVQQISSGAPVTPVVAQCLTGSVILTAAAAMAASTDYFVYIARF